MLLQLTHSDTRVHTIPHSCFDSANPTFPEVHHFVTTTTNPPFSTLPLRDELLAATRTLDYTSMTPVQMNALPPILDGKDVMAQARTGSGKTAAFALGLLNKLDIQIYKTQALVLCPTRELSDQVASEIRRLASALPNTKVLTLCGGKPMQDQLTSLKRDAHVIVGTPGRILKHLEKGSLVLNDIQTLVLDEADRMLDMGFHDDIMRILGKTSAQRQTLLFSATYPDQIQDVSAAIQVEPVEIRVDEAPPEEQIHQLLYNVTESNKVQALQTVLGIHQPDSCIVFCNRKQHCQTLATELGNQGYSVKALHGDLEQFDRDEAMIQFANGSVAVLVATDVAARGLDISELSAVINFDLAHDPETHVHRIGRTGRAGNEGLAISFVLGNEKHRVAAIEEYSNKQLPVETLPAPEARGYKPAQATTVTLHISGGKKDKVRPGDIVGALTANDALSKEQIGKIKVLDKMAYVAVSRAQTQIALDTLSNGKIKGRRFRVRTLR